MLYFPLGLDADVPLAVFAGDGDIAQFPQHLAAVAVAYPTQFWQENTIVTLIEFDLLGIRVTKAVTTTFALKAWKIGTLGKEVFVRFFQILQGMLQGL